MDIHQSIDEAILNRNFPEVQKLLQSQTALLSNPYYQQLDFKVRKFQELGVNESRLLTPSEFVSILEIIIQKFEPSIDTESLKYSIFNFVEADDLAEIEKTVFEYETQFETFEFEFLQLDKKILEQQITRKVSYLETIYKLIQSPKQKNSKSFNSLKELREWKKYFIKTVQEIKNKKAYYNIFRKPLKQLYISSINQVLYILSMQPMLDVSIYFQILTETLKNDITSDLMNIDTKIVTIYDVSKAIFPLIEPHLTSGKCDKFQLLIPQLIDLINILFGMKIPSNIIRNWNDAFIILMLLVFQQIEVKSINQLKHKTMDKQLNKEIIKLPFQNELWYYVSVNFTQMTIKLKKITKEIISHHIYSLINFYSIRFGKLSLMSKMLEDLMVTPFEDDILRMKMCINLFTNEDYTKLHMLVQSLLAAEKIKEHPFRQVIISLCSVFTGIHLGKFEEGLCFARLNLQEYETLSTQKILQRETVYAHIGFSYYNLARNSKYVTEKNNYFAKAEEYLNKSLNHNPQNFMVHFNLSKLYSIQGRNEEALKRAQQSCSLNKSDVNSMILQALLLTSKNDDNKKALFIVDQILKENPEKPILNLIKASIMAEKFLQNLQKDKELQVTGKFSPDLKKFYIKKHQKSRDAQNILNQLQKALVAIAKQVTEVEVKDSFISELMKLKTLQSLDLSRCKLIIFQKYISQCILNILDILINLEFFDVAQQVVELIDDFNEENIIERKYYEGLINEKMQNTAKAIEIYEDILKEDFYHVNAMTKLALLYLKNDQNKLQRANELLIVASKFVLSPDICLGFAYLNKQQGNINDADKYLLQSLDLIKRQPVISFHLVPDRLFYLS